MSCMQHTRLPCPSLSPWVCSNSCPLSQWCHPTISSSVIPFSSCPQSFPASGSFPVSQIFVSGGQSIGASASVLQMDIQSWFPCRPGNSQESSLAPQFKSINSSVVSLLYGTTLTSVHDYYKSCSLIIWTFVGKVMSLLINALSRFVRAFLPRSKCLLLLWLQSQLEWFWSPRK